MKELESVLMEISRLKGVEEMMIAENTLLREKLEKITSEKPKLCPECDSEIAVCMMGHYCGEVITRKGE